MKIKLNQVFEIDGARCVVFSDSCNYVSFVDDKKEIKYQVIASEFNIEFDKHFDVRVRVKNVFYKNIIVTEKNFIKAYDLILNQKFEEIISIQLIEDREAVNSIQNEENWHDPESGE